MRGAFMIYVSSDLHGYSLEKFKKLLSRAGFGDDDYLFILGDVIDRGSDGVKILEWLMLQPNIELIRGNHEDMLLRCDFLFDEVTESNIDSLSAYQLSSYRNWKRNGASPTIEALRALSPERWRLPPSG